MFDQSILPPTQTTAEFAFETAIAKTRPDLSPIPSLLNADTCPSALLGWLAWSMSVDEWDPDWSEDDKRETIRQSVNIQRKKGTLLAVKAALKAAGYGDATVIEGKEATLYDGAVFYDGSTDHAGPDHWAEYRVTLMAPITIDQASQVRRILEAVAPVHCHLKGLFFTQAANRYNGAIKYDGSFTHGVV